MTPVVSRSLSSIRANLPNVVLTPCTLNAHHIHTHIGLAAVLQLKGHCFILNNNNEPLKSLCRLVSLKEPETKCAHARLLMHRPNDCVRSGSFDLWQFPQFKAIVIEQQHRTYSLQLTLNNSCGKNLGLQTPPRHLLCGFLFVTLCSEPVSADNQEHTKPNRL